MADDVFESPPMSASAEPGFQRPPSPSVYSNTHTHRCVHLSMCVHLQPSSLSPHLLLMSAGTWLPGRLLSCRRGLLVPAGALASHHK